MKLYHYTIIFLVIFILFSSRNDAETDSYIVTQKQREKIDQSFSKAIDDSTKNLVEIDGIENIKVNKERAVNNFLLTMYSSLDIMNDTDKQELLKSYIPVMAVTCEEGYYIYYGDEYKDSSSYTYISKRWSEMIPFYYEDDDFIYNFTLTDTLSLYDKKGLLDTTKEQEIFTLDFHDLSSDEAYSNFRGKRPDSFLLDEESFFIYRRECIINAIEKSLSFYCSNYNKIAAQYGITYNFALPVIDNSEWTRSIDDPCVIIIFQGYPYGTGIQDTYNRFAIAGAQIDKDIVYYLEQKDWYFIYHKADCPELKKEGVFILDEPLYTISDCVKKGAYACEECSPDSGVYAPEYEP